jgi:hypothetical protein
MHEEELKSAQVLNSIRLIPGKSLKTELVEIRRGRRFIDEMTLVLLKAVEARDVGESGVLDARFVGGKQAGGVLQSVGVGGLVETRFGVMEIGGSIGLEKVDYIFGLNGISGKMFRFFVFTDIILWYA